MKVFLYHYVAPYHYYNGYYFMKCSSISQFAILYLQVPLNLESIGADFYTGNFHKWVFTPRGCAILWVNPKNHHMMRGPITSHFLGHETFQYDFLLQVKSLVICFHFQVTIPLCCLMT